MRRGATYAGASVAATVAVVLRAFHERPNFYSACVYLGQSTACRMILLNMLLLTLGTTLYGLQRLLYGRLRAIEIEQLWDKAWYAITETALAMTTFRDEVGGYFFVMFMTLLAGKVWGWIGEGRVETLEQQPPANPRLFHTRLVLSLALSQAFDFLMLQYCVASILDQHPPKAGMMIMFVFEFAILAISSTATTTRYLLALQEKVVIRQQIKARVEERREELRAARETAAGQAHADIDTSGTAAQPVEEEIDENEIDVPGWQEKGKFILFLDLTTELLKLVLYLAFFLVLLFFAGIPIHMFRDLFVTGRSFIKRINDYRKYRNATRDMNSRYADATAEELERDGTCIICREEMRLWQPREVNAAGRPNRTPPDERQRPKKLPCGHILHFGCLRSWLERQQVCPTCRRSVLAPEAARPQTSARGQEQNGDMNQNHNQNQRQAPREQGNRQGRGAGAQPPANENQQQRRNGIRTTTFNLGSIRLTFATGNAQAFQNALNQRNGAPAQQNDAGNQNGDGSQNALRQAIEQINQRQSTAPSASTISEEIGAIERRITQELQNLNVSSEQLVTVRALQNELTRLRQTTESSQTNLSRTGSTGAGMTSATRSTQGQAMQSGITSQQQVLSGQQQQMLGRGHVDLPAGMTLPEGWTLLPLRGVETRPGRETNETAEDSIEVVPQASLPSGRSQADSQEQSTAQEPPSEEATRYETASSSGVAQTEQISDVTARPTPVQEGEETSSGSSSVETATALPRIPNWSSTESTGTSERRTADDAEASETSGTNGHAPEDKGKGRAVTVEDEEG